MARLGGQWPSPDVHPDVCACHSVLAGSVSRCKPIKYLSSPDESGNVLGFNRPYS
jgi:hypothetical protein